MKSIGFIPLRKNSKGIPGKNKKRILGRPLYQWVLGEAILSNLSEIFIYTDDDEIIKFVKNEYAWCPRIKAMRRSSKGATDTATTEKAMLEFTSSVDAAYDTICLLQATSPLTTHKNINEALFKIDTENFDSVLSVVRTKRFIWNKNAQSINYDYKNRPRRQDFDGLLMENGAVYACKKQILEKYKNRLGGKIGLIEMPEDSLTEIDEEHDLILIESLLKNRLSTLKKPISKIRYLALDVDGVFTDGTIHYNIEGEFSKQYSVIDGMGLQLIREAGIEVIVITSEDSPIVHSRMKKLGITHYFSGVKDKYSRLNQFLADHQISRNEVAYVGDDINDLANMLSCQWGICPANTPDEINYHADLVLQSKSGDRVIRESAEFILNYNKRF